MKKLIIIIISILFIGILLFSIFNFSTEIEQNVNIQNEILPEEEISEEQNLETEIKLYFTDSTSNILTYEIRKINSKELIQNPYKYILELLFKGPINNKYKNEIPDGTKINNVNLKKEILYIDLSEEFLNSNGMNSIYSIVNTMCQFNEIEKIKITINGEDTNTLKEYYTINEQ